MQTTQRAAIGSTHQSVILKNILWHFVEVKHRPGSLSLQLEELPEESQQWHSKSDEKIEATWLERAAKMCNCFEILKINWMY